MNLFLTVISFFAFGFWVYVAIEPEAAGRSVTRMGFLTLAIFMLAESSEHLLNYLGQ